MITKKAKVIMLPTKHNILSIGQIYLPTTYHSTKLCISIKNISETIHKPQHLYFITDDEIKEGDWVYNIFLKSIRKATGNDKADVKKIIATTDKSLKFWTNDENGKHIWSLPQPSQAFIEKYCKVGGIDEVLVEYITDEELNKKKHCQIDCNGTQQKNNSNCCRNILTLKVDLHNTITIHPIKDSWTRKELLSFGNKCFIAGGKSVANKTYQSYDEYLETIDV